jgi:hypothetical protein
MAKESHDNDGVYKYGSCRKLVDSICALCTCCRRKSVRKESKVVKYLKI